MSAPESSDADLLMAYVAGNVAAFDELLARYQQPLYSWLRRHLGSESEVDDVFQEVWVRVVRHAPRFRNTSFRAWLWRIARNLLIDRLRRQKPVVSLDTLPVVGKGDDSDGVMLGETIPSGGSSPIEDLMNRELGEVMESAIRRLSPIHREIFLMRTEGDLSFNEIAEVLSIPLNTALGRMHDAVAKLRIMVSKDLDK